MKTLLFATAFIEDKFDWYFRYRLWISYSLYEYKFWDSIVLFHDGPVLYEDAPQIIPIIELGGGKLGKIGYSGWARSFFHSVEYAKANGFDKVVHIESDAFVLSQKMKDYIKDFNSGWVVFWSPRFKFPENSIQVICKDAFPLFEAEAQKFKNGVFYSIIEKEMNYPLINKDFVGDRYGENDVPFNDKMDFYCQYYDRLKKQA